jgi:hypothetical protein
MAKLDNIKQGVFDINNVQGNYVLIPLVFKRKNGIPIDLIATYKRIRMEIKTGFNVNIKPFLVFEIGDGLTISGDDNEILSFELDEAFWTSQVRNWVYDITFVDQLDKPRTLIKGNITNILTASSV